MSSYIDGLTVWVSKKFSISDACKRRHGKESPALEWVGMICNFLDGRKWSSNLHNHRR
jgi:hypothetical protein